MGRMPKNRAAIDALAEAMMAGLLANRELFPADLFNPEPLVILIGKSRTMALRRRELKLALQRLDDEEKHLHARKVQLMRQLMRSARSFCKGDPARLALIGLDAHPRLHSPQNGQTCAAEA
ncbi:hypothetical protein LLG95_07690 [bacterium]|nr:hypothetical protein [bacterium]